MCNDDVFCEICLAHNRNLHMLEDIFPWSLKSYQLKTSLENELEKNKQNIFYNFTSRKRLWRKIYNMLAGRNHNPLYFSSLKFRQHPWANCLCSHKFQQFVSEHFEKKINLKRLKIPGDHCIHILILCSQFQFYIRYTVCSDNDLSSTFENKSAELWKLVTNYNYLSQ